jgi:hypothetical protein
VRGAKELGLWDAMVCWPLRSAQNAGTGTTAYSLGGLGTFNGTLVNSPTWGAAGVALAGASSQYINTNYSLPADNNFVFAVGRFTSGSFGDLITADGQMIIVLRNDSGAIFTVSNPTPNAFVSGVIPINTFTSLAIRKPAGAPATGWRDGAQVGGNSQNSDAYNAATQPVLLGCRNLSSPAVFLTGDISFAMTCTSAVGAAVVYSLYKATLGKGLGLA